MMKLLMKQHPRIHSLDINRIAYRINADSLQLNNKEKLQPIMSIVTFIFSLFEVRGHSRTINKCTGACIF